VLGQVTASYLTQLLREGYVNVVAGAPRGAVR
jgi:hypothetical protein